MPNAVSYIKNLSKSIGYSAIDSIKESNPSITSFIETNEDILKTTYSALKNYKQTAKNISDKIKTNDYYKAGIELKENIFDDLKTGKFYNRERLVKVEDRMMKSMMGDPFEGMDSDFDTSGYNFDENYSDEWNLEDSANAMDEVGEKVSNAVGNVTARSADYVAETSIYNTNKLADHIKTLTGQLSVGLDTINQNIASVIEFNNEVFKTHVDNSTTFFTAATDSLNKQTELLTEIRDLTKQSNGIITERVRSKDKKLKYDDIVDSEGMIDIAKYLTAIKDNIKSGTSTVTDMLEVMGTGDANMIHTMTASPLKVITDSLVKLVIPKMVKQSMEEFNTSLSGIFASFMMKLNSAEYSDNIIMRGLNKIFGIDNTFKRNMDTSKYIKGPIPFDGETKKSITEVMPGQLAKIISLLSGEELKLYNFDEGNYIKESELKEQSNNIIENQFKMATYDLNDELDEIMNTIKFENKEDKENILNEIKNMFKTSFKHGTFTNHRKINAENYYDYGITDPENINIIKGILESINNTTLLSTNREIMDARMSISNRMKRLESSGGIENFMYNNYFNDKKKIESKSGIIGNLNAQTDDLGHNIFYYMQNMFKELNIIRTVVNSGSIGGIGLNSSGILGGNSSTIVEVDDSITKYIPNNNEDDIENREREIERENQNFQNEEEKLDRDNAHRVSISELRTLDRSEITERIREANRLQHENDTEDDKAKNKNSTFLDQLNEADSITGKIKVFTGRLQELIQKPAKFMAGVLQKADQRLFDLIYGKEGEPDDRSLITRMLDGIKGSFNKFNTWLDENILTPIKTKFSKEKIHDAAKRFFGLFGIDIDDTVDKAKRYLFGDKNEDGNRVGGLFSDLIQDTKEHLKNFWAYTKGAFKDVYSPVTSLFTGWSSNSTNDNIENNESDRNQENSNINDSVSEAIHNAADALHNNAPNTNNEENDNQDQDEEIPTYSKGTSYVPKTTIAALTEGEMVIPRELNPFYDGPDSSKESQKDDEQKLIDKWYKKYGNTIKGFAEGTTEIKPEEDEVLDTDADILHNSVIPKQDSDFKSGVKNVLSEAGKRTAEGLQNVAEQLGVLSADNETHEKFKKAVHATADEVHKNGGAMIAGGIIGTGASLLTGIANPLLGAVTGAAVGLLKDSKLVREAVFGKFDNEGNRIDSGILSNNITDTIMKYVPDMAKYGLVGGLTSIIPFVPGGPLTGIMLGSAIGFAKNNEEVKDFLFGEVGEDGKRKGGILPDASKIKEKLQKALPNMTAGAIGGLLMGPFGIAGNMIFGSALGYATSTEKFKDALFGEMSEDGKRKGGIIGSLKTEVVDPLKNFVKNGIMDTKKWFIDNVFKPLADSVKPIKKEFSLIFKATFGKVAEHLNKLFSDTVGAPLNKFLEDKVFKPITKLTKFVITQAMKPTKFVVSAPAKIIGKYGDHLRRKHIRKGNADYMTAAERNEYRSEQKRGLFHRKGRIRGDKFRDFDETLENMNTDQLEDINDAFTVLKDTDKGSKELENRSLKTISDNIYKAKDIDYDTAKNVMKRIKDGNYKKAAKLLRRSDLEDTERDRLFRLINEEGSKLETVRDIGKNQKKSKNKLYEKLETYYGFTGINDKNLDKFSKLFKKEYNERSKTPEEQIMDQSQQQHSEIVNLFRDALDELRALNDPEYKEKLFNKKHKKISKENSKRKGLFGFDYGHRDLISPQDIEEEDTSTSSREHTNGPADVESSDIPVPDENKSYAERLKDKFNVYKQWKSDRDEVRSQRRQASEESASNDENRSRRLRDIINPFGNSRSDSVDTPEEIAASQSSNNNGKRRGLGDFIADAKGRILKLKNNAQGEPVVDEQDSQTAETRREQENEENTQNKISESIGSVGDLIHRLFGKKKDDEDNGDEKSSKNIIDILKGIAGKIGKFSVTVFATATAVSLFAKLHDWWEDVGKTNLVNYYDENLSPKIAETISNHLDGIYKFADHVDTFTNTVTELITGLPDLMGDIWKLYISPFLFGEGPENLMGFIQDKVVPFYLNGLEFMSQNVIPFGADLILKSVPYLLKGIVVTIKDILTFDLSTLFDGLKPDTSKELATDENNSAVNGIISEVNNYVNNSYKNAEAKSGVFTTAIDNVLAGTGINSSQYNDKSSLEKLEILDTDTESVKLQKQQYNDTLTKTKLENLYKAYNNENIEDLGGVLGAITHSTLVRLADIERAKKNGKTSDELEEEYADVYNMDKTEMSDVSTYLEDPDVVNAIIQAKENKNIDLQDLDNRTDAAIAGKTIKEVKKMIASGKYSDEEVNMMKAYIKYKKEINNRYKEVEAIYDGLAGYNEVKNNNIAKNNDVVNKARNQVEENTNDIVNSNNNEYVYGDKDKMDELYGNDEGLNDVNYSLFRGMETSNNDESVGASSNSNQQNQNTNNTETKNITVKVQNALDKFTNESLNNNFTYSSNEALMSKLIPLANGERVTIGEAINSNLELGRVDGIDENGNEIIAPLLYADNEVVTGEKIVSDKNVAEMYGYNMDELDNQKTNAGHSKITIGRTMGTVAIKRAAGIKGALGSKTFSTLAKKGIGPLKKVPIIGKIMNAGVKVTAKGLSYAENIGSKINTFATKDRTGTRFEGILDRFTRAGVNNADDVANLTGRAARKAAKKLAKAERKAARKAALKSTKAYSIIAKGGEQVKSLARVAKKYAGKAATSVGTKITARAADGKLISKFLVKLKDGIGKILAHPKISAMLGRAAGEGGEQATKSIAKAIQTKLINAIGKVLGKKAATISAKIAASLAAPGVTQLAMAIYGAVYGWSNANSIMGTLDQPSAPLRFMCAILSALNESFLYGLVPLDILVDIALPIFKNVFKLDTSDIDEERINAKEEVEEYNRLNGTNYTVYEYNNKDKFLTKVTRAVSSGANAAKEAIFGKSISDKDIDQYEESIKDNSESAEIIRELLNSPNAELSDNDKAALIDKYNSDHNTSYKLEDFDTIIEEVKKKDKEVTKQVKLYKKNGSKDGLVQKAGKALETIFMGEVESKAWYESDGSYYTYNKSNKTYTHYNIHGDIIEENVDEKVIKAQIKSGYLKEGVIRGESGISKGIKSLGAGAVKFFNKGIKFASKAFTKAGEAISDAIKDPAKTVTNAISWFIPSITEVYYTSDGSYYKYNKDKDDFSYYSSNGDLIGDKIPKDIVLEDFKKGILSKGVKVKAPKFATKIADLIKLRVKNTAEGLKVVGSLLVDFGSIFVDSMKDMGKGIKEHGLFGGIKKFFVDSQKAYFDTSGSYYVKQTNGTYTYFNPNGDLLAENISEDIVNQKISTGLLVAKDIPKKSKASEAIDKISNAIGEAWSKAQDVVSTSWNDFKSWLGLGGQGTKDALEKLTSSSSISVTNKPKAKTVKQTTYYNVVNKPKVTSNDLETDPIAMAAAKGSGFVSQVDKNIADVKYGNSTLEESGCGPAVAATAINKLYNKSNIDIKDAAKYAEQNKYVTSDGATDISYFRDIFGKYGIDTRYNTDKKNIQSSLLNGNSVVLMGTDSNNNSKKNSPFGPSPHYVLANRVTNNGKYVYIDDPESNKPNKRYRLDKILNSTEAGVSLGSGFGSKYPYAGIFAKGSDQYLDQDLCIYEPITADEINAWIKSKSSDSPFNGHGDIFIEASRQSGYDPRYILAHAAHESGWGKSNIAKDKNNYFGIGAFDATPYSSAYSFGSGLAAGIIEGAKWIKKYYYFGNYKQTTLRKMRFNNGKHEYATDSGWATKIASIMDGAPHNGGAKVDGSSVMPGDETTYSTSTATTSGFDASTSTTDSTSSTKTNVVSTITSLFNQLNEDIFGVETPNSQNTSSTYGTNIGDTTKGSNIVNEAKKYVGKVKYSYGANKLKDYSGTADCSSFTQNVFKNAAGIDIGRTTVEQIKDSDLVDVAGNPDPVNNSKQMDWNTVNPQPGDLILWTGTYGGRHGDTPSHVGIYGGDDTVIHNSSSKGVVETKLSTYGPKAIRVRRAKGSTIAANGTNQLYKNLNDNIVENTKEKYDILKESSSEKSDIFNDSMTEISLAASGSGMNKKRRLPKKINSKDLMMSAKGTTNEEKSTLITTKKKSNKPKTLSFLKMCEDLVFAIKSIAGHVSKTDRIIELLIQISKAGKGSSITEVTVEKTNNKTDDIVNLRLSGIESTIKALINNASSDTNNTDDHLDKIIEELEAIASE